MKIKEYGSGGEGDVVNDARNGEKDDWEGKGVRTWAGREYSGNMVRKRKSRNTTPLLGLKTTQLHV